MKKEGIQTRNRKLSAKKKRKSCDNFSEMTLGDEAQASIGDHQFAETDTEHGSYGMYSSMYTSQQQQQIQQHHQQQQIHQNQQHQASTSVSLPHPEMLQRPELAPHLTNSNISDPSSLQFTSFDRSFISGDDIHTNHQPPVYSVLENTQHNNNNHTSMFQELQPESSFTQQENEFVGLIQDQTRFLDTHSGTETGILNQSYCPQSTLVNHNGSEPVRLQDSKSELTNHNSAESRILGDNYSKSRIMMNHDRSSDLCRQHYPGSSNIDMDTNFETIDVVGSGAESMDFSSTLSEVLNKNTEKSTHPEVPGSSGASGHDGLAFQTY